MVVGSRQIILVVSVLVAIGIGFLMIQRIQDSGKQELQIEQLERQIEARERIDEAIISSPTNSDSARGVLQDFIDSRE
jgi:hypothetical protein